MTLTKTLMLSAAAAAFLLAGANSSALADQHVHEVCGTLPNPGWSWQVSTTPGETFYDNFDPAGASGNVKADQFQAAGTTTCTAINPGNQVNDDKSHEVSGGDPVLIAEGVWYCHPTEGVFTKDECPL